LVEAQSWIGGNFLDLQNACNFVGAEADSHSIGEANSCENGVVGNLGYAGGYFFSVFGGVFVLSKSVKEVDEFSMVVVCRYVFVCCCAFFYTAI
jgi:hypothetical protein